MDNKISIDSLKYQFFNKLEQYKNVNELLEDERVDPSARNNCAICFASSNGHLDIVNRLLEDPRVDPSDDYNIAIRWASFFSHSDITERLLLDERVFKKLNKKFAIALLNNKEINI